jgi:hypothetical protein
MNGPTACKKAKYMVSVNMDYQYEQHTVHLIVYHIIWCPKRRSKVLQGDIAKRLEQIVDEVAKEREWEVIRLAIQDEAIKIVQFIRNKCLCLWMDERGISKNDLQCYCARPTGSFRFK